MKIVKKGRKIEVVMGVICPRCKAELEFNANDLSKQEVSGGPFDHPFEYFFNCPCCNRKIWVEYSKMTKEMQYDVTH